jgi:SAM-dependent methyltransferase
LERRGGSTLRSAVNSQTKNNANVKWSKENKLIIDPSHDAYGEELKAYDKNGKDTIEIVERSDGYIDYHDGIPYYFSSYTDWSEYEKSALSYCYGRVADVGCGAGRIALYLQKKGHAVVGIDNSPGAIQVCRARGVKELLNIPFTQIDRRVGIIDSFVLFGNNFGLFGSPTRARWLLRRLKSLSSGKALIIAQTTDPYRTKDPDHLVYHEQNRKRGRLGGQTRIRIRYKRIIGSWMDYLLVSKQELERIIEGTGWAVKQYIDTDSAGYFVILEKD